MVCVTFIFNLHNNPVNGTPLSVIQMSKQWAFRSLPQITRWKGAWPEDTGAPQVRLSPDMFTTLAASWSHSGALKAPAEPESPSVGLRHWKLLSSQVVSMCSRAKEPHTRTGG